MIVRIYTGQDGQTHFEDLPPPAEESHKRLRFKRAPISCSAVSRRTISAIGHTAPPAAIHFYSRGAGGKSGSAMAPRAVLGPGDVVPRRRFHRPGPHDALGGRSPHQCHCAGGRLMPVLAPIHA